jgi:MYXO-CTERM domain-containing protein
MNQPSQRRSVGLAAAACVVLSARAAGAMDVMADHTDYVAKLATLKPGDTLHLAADTYDTLAISNLNGTASQWITITGPAADPPTAVIQASPDGCCDVVELTNSSFVALVNLKVDGNHVNSAFGVSAKGETGNLVHDVRIEGCTLVDIDNDGDPTDLGQQDDGISTKTPTWGWIIRGNKILGAGTGLYLGNSTGSDPFVQGLIEDNLVDSPTGYCMEIKQQNPWPAVQGMPTGPTTTIIRNNVFIKKDHAATTSGGRPQILVDGFPDTGSGSQNHYEIYGNLFFHDSDDYLLQATGRVHVHDNIFVDDPMYGGVNFTDHDSKTVIDAIAYNNTFYGVGTGVAFGSAPSGIGFAVGNAIFGPTPFAGMVATQHDNVTDTVANAPMYVNSPGLVLGMMDFYPKSGSPLRGSAVDLSMVSNDTDYDRDFNGTKKDFTYRGAYSGQGMNPGWQLGDGIKDGGATDGGSSGASSGGGSSGGGSSSGAGSGSSGGASGSGGGDGGGNGAAPGSSGGCGCAMPGDGASTGLGGAVSIAAMAIAFARRRRTAPASRPPDGG